MFTGREWNALTGLSHHRARQYSPSLGRWTGPDPIGEAGGLNLYGYVGNAVTEWIDPLGLFGIGAYADIHTARALYPGPEVDRERLLELDRVTQGTLIREALEAGSGGTAAFFDGVIPFASPFADTFDHPYGECESGDYDFSQTTGRYTRNMWMVYFGARAGSWASPRGGMGHVQVGSGSPIHVAWGANGRTIHAWGDIGRQIITRRGLQDWTPRLTITRIPVINTNRLLEEGRRVKTCVGAAAGAFGRSLWPF